MGVGLMVDTERMPEVQVGPTQDVEEELVLMLVVQPVVGVAMMLVVGVSTGTSNWVLLVLVVTTHQRRTNMLAGAQGSMVSRKHVSLGLAIVGSSSLYPLCCSCCFHCCITCYSLVQSRQHSHHRQPRQQPSLLSQL